VANGLGLAGVLLALALTFIPSAFFLMPADAQVIGLFIFVAGYAAIIYGCWWWVRAKNWVETVVLIGLSPLVVFSIPWVRLLYLIPGVLPLMMVMMPVLMIGVVAALPDKSGMPQRKRWRVG
jgi:hypothetical protein